MEKRSKLNPPLKVGDKIVLLKSIEDSLPGGTKGVVTDVRPFNLYDSDSINYHVKWENGSSLAMLSDVDSWALVNDIKNKESIKEQLQDVNEISEILDNFKFRVLYKFLSKLRNSGVINMFGAAPYLYLGRDRIENMHHYDPITEDNYEYEEMLDLAEDSKNEMITGTIKLLEKNNKEWGINDVNRTIGRNANKILKAWITTHSI